MTLPLSLTDIVTFVAVVLLTVYNVVNSNRKDKRQEIAAENNAMQLLRTTVNTYRDEVDKLKTDVHDQGKAIEKLKGIIEEKDKQLLMFERIFQNRNPEMDQFMREVGTEAKNNALHRQESQELFSEMVRTLKSIQETLRENGFHKKGVHHGRES